MNIEWHIFRTVCMCQWTKNCITDFRNFDSYFLTIFLTFTFALSLWNNISGGRRASSSGKWSGFNEISNDCKHFDSVNYSWDLTNSNSDLFRSFTTVATTVFRNLVYKQTDKQTHATKNDSYRTTVKVLKQSTASVNAPCVGQCQ